ncbi:MAG: ABC transporter ATP-binding protein [Granulosicoccus sp.]
MAEIEIRSLTKQWGLVKGVDNIDLHIKDEEFIVLLGPSGCGKTTTMRMIAGLTDLSAGEIYIDGQNVNDVDARDRDVAMVFQGYALYPNMTIYENIRFPLRMRKVPKKQQDPMIREAARKVQLENLLDRKPSALSGGQRQRAALARALVRQPRAFLMDEPLSNLDAKLRSSMRVQLKHLQKSLKVTTVYVTHDQIEAMTLADRVVIMNNARIQQIGTPDEIYNDPKNTFVAGFIGSPPMNLLTGNLSNGRLEVDGFFVDGVEHSDKNAITIGIRPENISAEDKLETKRKLSFQGTLYGLEPTGDQTILSVKCGEQLVEVKEGKDFRQELDTPVRCFVDPQDVMYFDGVTSERIYS